MVNEHNIVSVLDLLVENNCNVEVIKKVRDGSDSPDTSETKEAKIFEKDKKLALHNVKHCQIYRL